MNYYPLINNKPPPNRDTFCMLCAQRRTSLKFTSVTRANLMENIFRWETCSASNWGKTQSVTP